MSIGIFNFLILHLVSIEQSHCPTTEHHIAWTSLHQFNYQLQWQAKTHCSGHTQKDCIDSVNEYLLMSHQYPLSMLCHKFNQGIHYKEPARTQ